MIVRTHGNYKVCEARTNDYYVESADGLIHASFGYNTDRGKTLAFNRANAAASSLHLKEIHQANREIVSLGKCPTCGRGIERNLSLAGWWQCEQFGAENFRKNPELPPCNWQCFTE